MKDKALKGAFALVTAFAFLAVPLFMLLSSMKNDSFEVSLRHNMPVSISVAVDNSAAGGKEFTVSLRGRLQMLVGQAERKQLDFAESGKDLFSDPYVSFLPDTGIDLRDCRIDFIGTEGTVFLLDGVRINHHQYFTRIVSGADLLDSYLADGMSLELVNGAVIARMNRSNASLTPKPNTLKSKFKVDLCHFGGLRHGIEIVVVLIAISMLFAIRSNLVSRGSLSIARSDVAKVASIAAAASFFAAIALPLSTFANNREIFGFSAALLFRHAVARFAVVFPVLFALLTASLPALGFLPAALVLAATCFGYLEIGPLSLGLPQLNGEMSFFSNRCRMALDSGILIVFLSTAYAFADWVRRYSYFIAIGVIIMCLSVCADAMIGKDANGKYDGNDAANNGVFATIPEVVSSVVYSSDRNVLMFGLDSITTDAACAALENHPEWIAQLPGFTAYTNNVGMFDHTKAAMAGMLTGTYPEGDETESDFGWKVFSERTFARAYREADVPVFLDFLSVGNFGWTNQKRHTGRRETAAHGPEGPFARRAESQMAWNLGELCVFRAIPFAMKKRYFDNRAKSWFTARGNTELAVFPVLARADVREDVPLTLQVHLTMGGHGPYTTGRDGTVHFPRYSFSDYLEQCEFAIGRLVSLLGSLRKKGVYDSSLIVVYADHGAMPENSPPQDITPKAFPFLWVKPANDAHAFAFSSISTSHSKIHDLVEASFSRNLSNEEVGTLIYQEKRLFYPVFGRTGRKTIVLDERRFQIEEKPGAGRNDG